MNLHCNLLFDKFIWCDFWLKTDFSNVMHGWNLTWNYICLGSCARKELTLKIKVSWWQMAHSIYSTHICYFDCWSLTPLLHYIHVGQRCKAVWHYSQVCEKNIYKLWRTTMLLKILHHMRWGCVKNLCS